MASFCTETARSGIADGRGLLIVHTGEGKGKTTAALGLILRAWGHGMKAIMLQFLKRPSSVCGEHLAAARLGIPIIAGGAGFTRGSKNERENRKLADELWRRARDYISSGQFDLVVLDEFTYPLQYGWLPVEEVVDALTQRPARVHVVITGREAPNEIVDAADIVIDVKSVKHPLRKGIRAQRGIEY